MISIIIPVYNGEKHIPAMLGCLCAQTASGMAFEAVFVNDGSTDGSLALLHQAEKSEPFPIRVIDQENGGVSAARNAGLRAAQGKYITFADVDDLLSPDYIAALSACVQNEAAKEAKSSAACAQKETAKEAQRGADLVRFGFGRVDAKAMSIPSGGKTPCEKREKDAMLRAFLADPKLFGPYGFLFRRDFLTKNGLLFAEGYAYYEDYDFIVRAIALAEDLRETHGVYYAYRQADGSAMMRYNAQRVHCLSLADDLCAFLAETGCAAAGDFAKWYKARLYWAALWQACMALPTPGDAARFVRLTGGKALLGRLADYPGKKVALTAVLGQVSPRTYAVLAKRMGAGRSLLKPMSRAEADALFAAISPAPSILA